MDTLLHDTYDTHPIARMGHMLGSFATFLGGALLPIALLLLGIGLTRPGSLAIFTGMETLQTLPLAGLGLASLGLVACRGTDHATPLSCWLGLGLNLAAWLIIRLA